MADRVPIAEHLFTTAGDAVRLIGGSCPACGTVTFPFQKSCPKCMGTAMEERLLGPRGRLWSFTVQGFCPKPPYRGPAGDEFVPYGVGYVELEGCVIVEGRLTENDPERLTIGQDMELVLESFTRDAGGSEVVTFAFAPAPVRQEDH